MVPMKKIRALVLTLCALMCLVPAIAMADDGAGNQLAIGMQDSSACIDSIIATNWGSYEGCTQWLGVNAEVSGTQNSDELTFFLTKSESGTEADVASEGLICSCTVADLPERKAGVHNAGYQGVGFLVSGLPAGQYWLGCKLASGDVATYASNPRSFIVYESLPGFVDAALERLFACSRHSGLISEGADGRTVTLGAGGDYGDDWEAWMLPALVSGGKNPLFSSVDSTAYLNSVETYFNRVESGELGVGLTLKDCFRYVTALSALGEDPRNFRGHNVVATMMETADRVGIVENAKQTDPLFVSYFLFACKMACVTAEEGFSIADEAACYEALLGFHAQTAGTGDVSKYMMSDNYVMMMLPLCLPVCGDAHLQARVDVAKQQMLDAYANHYQYGNGGIKYGRPAADNSGFAEPNANSSAVFVNTFVLMGLDADDLAGPRWQKPYGSLMSAWMSQMNDNGWMTYAGNPANNEMATYQTLGALVDLHNSKSCFAIARERYLDAHPGFAAARVDDLIASLPGQPGIADEGSVSSARDAYNALTFAQRGLVTGLSALVVAEQSVANAKAEAETHKDKYHQLSGTVYLSFSHDAEFVVSSGSSSGLRLAHVPIDLAQVSKIDLDDYGLGRLKCEADSDDAGYLYETTLLQLFIYMHETYYADGINGMEVTGNKGSVYLKHFFGGDENLLYYVNGRYPLASAGWGATCESIALADGDCVDVAHFTSWSFYSDPLAGLRYFTHDGDVTREMVVRVGEYFELGCVRANANAAGNYETTFEPDGGTMHYAHALYADDADSAVVPVGGTASLSFDAVGDYYVWLDGGRGDWSNSVVSSPAVAVVHVVEGGVDGSGSEGGAEVVKEKSPNPMTVTAKAKSVKAKKLKKKSKTIKPISVKGAAGKVTFKLLKVSAKKKLLKQAKKKIKLAAGGKLRLGKKLKKGTYKVTVRVDAEGDAAFKPATRTVTIKIKVS